MCLAANRYPALFSGALGPQALIVVAFGDGWFRPLR
jgi:hypothetical protein